MLALDEHAIWAHYARWHSSHCFCTTENAILSDYNTEGRALCDAQSQDSDLQCSKRFRAGRANRQEPWL